jgi:NADH-quinone oxidoreductase subunit H
VEAEQELVGGFNTEYSSVRFALFFLAEFMNVVTMSAILTTLFLGGPDGPIVGPDWLHPVLPFVWFFAKVGMFLFIFVWFRATLPRLRYDQLMDLGWKVLIPLSLGWMMVVATARVANDRDWNVLAVCAAVALSLVAAAGMLTLAMRTSAARRELGEVDA